MKKIFAVTFILLLLMPMAQSEDGDANKKMPAETKSKQSSPAQSKKNNAKPLKEFVPSEEISVDRPVAFPVDI